MQPVLSRFRVLLHRQQQQTILPRYTRRSTFRRLATAGWRLNPLFSSRYHDDAPPILGPAPKKTLRKKLKITMRWSDGRDSGWFTTRNQLALQTDRGCDNVTLSQRTYADHDE